MLGRVASILILLSVPFRAETPVPEWRLEPVAWTEVSLCLRPCVLKARFVERYEWTERERP